MSVAAGPNVVSNGLVLEYDMSNTKRSWKGAPTVNQFAIPDPYNATGDVGFQVNGNGTFQRVTTGSFGGYDITADDIVYKYVLGATGCHYHGNDVTIQAGQVATWSFDYYVDPSVTGYPQTNYLANFEGVLGGSIADPTPSVIGVWKRLYFTGTAPSTGLCRMLLYPGACGDRLATGGFVLFKNPQVSFDTPGNLPLPFVAGTRSTSQSIVDLTNNNILTATSLTYVSDNQFIFNGTNNYATISTFTNKPTTAMSVESWIYPTKASVGTGLIRGGTISCTNSMYLGIIDSTDGGTTFSLHFANQTSVSRIYSWSGSVPNNQWSHIMGTYDGTTSRAYINGVEVWSAAQTGTIPDGTYVIGTYGGGLQDGVHNFNGSLPTGRIYNRGLSAAEVTQNFNALRGRYGI